MPLTDARSTPGREKPIRQVDCVGNAEDDELCMPLSGPVEESVQHPLLGRQETVDLVNHQHTAKKEQERGGGEEGEKKEAEEMSGHRYKNNKREKRKKGKRERRGHAIEAAAQRRRKLADVALEILLQGARASREETTQAGWTMAHDCMHRSWTQASGKTLRMLLTPLLAYNTIGITSPPPTADKKKGGTTLYYRHRNTEGGKDGKRDSADTSRFREVVYVQQSLNLFRSGSYTDGRAGVSEEI